VDADGGLEEGQALGEQSLISVDEERLAA